MSAAKKKRGQEHPCLQHFMEVDGAMVCQIKWGSDGLDDNEKICGESFTIAGSGEKTSGTRVGNLFRHLKRKHPNEAEVVHKLMENNDPKAAPKERKYRLKIDF